MGNNNSNLITINVNRDNLFYFTDEIIQGSVNLNVSEDELQMQKINVKLIGEVGYTTTERDSDSDRISGSKTVNHNIEFYSTELLLIKPEWQQKQLILNQGKYSWSFQFQIPSHLPPSTNAPELYPHIRYYLQVDVHTPWYQIRKWERKYLTLFPHVNVLENAQYLTSIEFEKQNKKQVKFQGTLQKSEYIPGESIDLKYTIENPENILIKSIDISLVQLLVLNGHNAKLELLETTLPNIFQTKDPLIKGMFSFTIPANALAPSYKFQDQDQSKDMANVSYIIKVQVHVQGLFADFDVEIPITIGTERDLLNKKD